MEAIKSAAEQRILHPLEAWHHHQDTVSAELGQLLVGHVERSGGLLGSLPDDPETYPAQKLTTPYVDSQTSGLEDVITTASLAEKHYLAMLDTLTEAEATESEMSRLGEDLSSGQNIVVITNHGEIKDIAIVLAAYYAGIRQAGIQNGKKYEFTNNILLSKMVAYLDVPLLQQPAVDVLGKMCDRQYFSFPKTDSIKHSRISPKLVDVYNSALRGVIGLRLHSGGNLFAIAPSGTIDKALDPEKPDELTMAPIGSGTTKILTATKTKILPVATWLQGDEPVFEPLGFPRSLGSEDEVHAVMGDIAEVLNKTVPDKHYIYPG